jgi:hypothetical protein
MNTNQAFTLTLGLAALCAGCAGTGPSTQRGAVGGALAGAVAGGVIGNNHGSHNTWSGAAIGAAAGGVAGAALGNAADQQRGTVYTNPSPYDTAPRQPVYAQPPVSVAPPVQQVQPQYPAQYEQPQTEYVVVQPPAYPPPPREVVTVRPAREAVWVQGYYAYTGRRGNPYMWVPGHWEVPPPGRYRTFVQPRWERGPQGYVYVRGYWR